MVEDDDDDDDNDDGDDDKFVITLTSLFISISFIADVNRMKVSYVSFVKLLAASGSLCYV